MMPLREKRAIGNVQILEFDIADMPVLGSVPCGTPMEDFDDIPHHDRKTVSRYISQHPQATYVFRIIGDSMIGADFYHGDLVFVDAKMEAQDGDIVLADIDGEMTVKTLRLKVKIFLQEFILVPENPHYEPIRFSDYSSVSIKGVVIGKLTSVSRRK